MTDVQLIVGSPDVQIITSGQGPPGPPGLPGGASDSIFTKQVDSNVVPGTPVYVTASNTLELALATGRPQTKVIGLSLTATAATFAATIQTQDIATLTTAEWDAVTGESGGLTPNGVYYLSTSTPGMLTQTPAVASPPLGRFNSRIGLAISPTQLDVQIRPPIQL